MKHWKCIIGATIATPIIMAMILGVLVGMGLLIRTCGHNAWFMWSAVGLLLIILSIWFMGIWMTLYEHCVEYWEKRGAE